MIELILWFSLSIIFSFLCSVWEAVLLSITPNFIRSTAQTNPSLHTKLKEYKADIDRPLSAILTLNTIAHTVGAIGVGASAGALFGGKTFDLSLFSISIESIIAVVMTLAILIASEIIPKTLGANNWQSLTPFTISSLGILIFLLTPFVKISQLITKRLKKDKDKSVLSRADVIALADEGRLSGAIDDDESKIIKNLLKLRHITVKDIMTPRTVVMGMDENTIIGDFYAQNQQLPYSRIPIFQRSLDNITGVVLKHELLKQMVEGNSAKKMGEIKRPIQTVHEDDKIDIVFNELTVNRQHIAVVMNQFGVMVGLVTMEDVVETLLGLEIVDETDTVDNLQELARKQWEKRNSKNK